MTGATIAEIAINSTTLALILYIFIHMLKKNKKASDKIEAKFDAVAKELAKNGKLLAGIYSEVKEVRKEQGKQSQQLTNINQ